MRKNYAQNEGIKLDDGTATLDKEDILKVWYDYVGELFADERANNPDLGKSIHCPYILKEEIKATVAQSEKGKIQEGLIIIKYYLIC